MLITVFTATYNRAHILENLYRSLMHQTFIDFEWLVVDDGSTDGTERLVQNWVLERHLPIRYFAMKHAGKQNAHNFAVEHAQGELFFSVDSDDYLPENALAQISSRAEELLANPSLASLIGLQSAPWGKIRGPKFPDNLHRATHRELVRMGLEGERAIIFKTEILRRYSFTIYGDEDFITEITLYYRIGQDYASLLTNDVLYISDYRSDGLSNNYLKNLIRNPQGSSELWAMMIDIAETPLQRFGYAMRYWAFCYLTPRNKRVRYSGPHITCLRVAKHLGHIARIYYLLRLKFKNK